MKFKSAFVVLLTVFVIATLIAETECQRGRGRSAGRGGNHLIERVSYWIKFSGMPSGSKLIIKVPLSLLVDIKVVTSNAKTCLAKFAWTAVFAGSSRVTHGLWNRSHDWSERSNDWVYELNGIKKSLNKWASRLNGWKFFFVFVFFFLTDRVEGLKNERLISWTRLLSTRLTRLT